MPPRFRFPQVSRAAVLLVLLLALFSGAFAEPRVRGTLSTATAAVGEAIEYELVIEGSELPDKPPVPQVDGIEVRGTSQSSQLSIVNTNVTRRVTLTYTLVPTRTGKFTIPPLVVEVGGRKMATQPATLTVTPGEPVSGAGDLAFGKIWLEKKNGYLGEVIPAELRLYLDSGARWDLRSAPALGGDGFTTQPLGKPAQRDVELAGKTYHLLTFRTMITPGKAGTLAIGPVPVNLLVSKRSRSQPQYLLFGPQFDPGQQITVAMPATELQVKPLPAEGRPKDFSGAIGKFEFTATGSPDRVKAGEPVSMKLTIRGRGNFDRIEQPPLAEPDGWTTYAAKQQFEPSDSLGAEGVKTFELPVTPNAAKNTMPVFAFSFFDVDAGKYVTLKNAPVPLQVEGAPSSLVADAASKSAGETKVETPAPAPAPPAVRDILANLPEPGAASSGFGLRVAPPVLFSVMFAPVPVLAALFALRSWRGNEKSRRAAALRRERGALLARVRDSSDRAEALDAAVRALQIDAASNDGGAASGAELAHVLAARRLGPDLERAVRELFEARNELLYAGGARGADEFAAGERDRVLETLAAYERSARK
jgi:hypothetical protein